MAPYMELPQDFSPRARNLADEVVTTAQADDPYSQALALQNYFRDQGVFENDGTDWEYALDPETTGHDNDAIEAFLESNEGYCEMYAGTYAAMARSIGLPARVAVGFTWGDVDANDPNLYHVKGKHAHAWPEVWLGEEIGWIAFEPTPGRGAPEMAGYADVEPAQIGETAEGVATSSTTTTTAPSSSSTTTTPLNQDDLNALLGTGQSNTDQRQGDDGTAVRGEARRSIALVLLVLVLVYAHRDADVLRDPTAASTQARHRAV